MVEDTTHTRLGRIAVQIARQEAIVKGLEKERTSYLCSRIGQHWDEETWERSQDEDGNPCWKGTVVEKDYLTGETETMIRPRDQWCPPCLARQETHERLKVQRKHLATMRGVLTRLARMAARRGEE